MTRKWFVLYTILAMAAIGVFVNNQATQAQRPERPRRSRDPGGGGRMNPSAIIDNSWAELTFSVKAEDEILLQARPIYQKSRDDLNQAIKEAREAGDFQGMRNTMTEIRQEFKTALKEILTEKQMDQLNKLEQRQMRQLGGRGGGRPGGGR
jgi:Spy/CpxP family protein refolding chaperone